jgi:hypothetical protein
MSTMSRPTSNGLRTSRGPKVRSGSSGSTTTATTRNLRVEARSSRLMAWASRLVAGRDESRKVATTAVPATTKILRLVGSMTPRVQASTPSRKESRKAASEVMPRPRSRRTSPW